ncbi:putative proteini [Pseudoloma neurophilia]|uniref:EF-hand domain-containing protein n=1 Tax=Pseudoloma neurophilia TaxID=146866 RepID=A0A0R0LZY3_9MICR|nr:putative proteini [Pseudoloma neurophilia]
MSQKDDMISKKYNEFLNDGKFTYLNLPTCIIACGRLPTSELGQITTEVLYKDSESKKITEKTEISETQFLEIFERCKPFKSSEELLKNILFFTDNQMVITKEQFEKLINMKDSNNNLTRNELDALYNIMNVKDGKINLEEFVSCVMAE